jgi:hypothetical protein
VEHHRLVALAGPDLSQPDHPEGIEERADGRDHRHRGGDLEGGPQERYDAGKGERDSEPQMPADPLAEQRAGEQGDEDGGGRAESRGVADSDAGGREGEEAADRRQRAEDAAAPGARAVGHCERAAPRGGEADGNDRADEETGGRDLGPRQVRGPEPGTHVHHREAELGEHHPAEPAARQVAIQGASCCGVRWSPRAAVQT